MDEVKKVISEILKIPIEKITMELSPKDVEFWDSLGQLQLISALERKFDICFETNEMFEIMCVGDIYTILRRKKVI